MTQPWKDDTTAEERRRIDDALFAMANALGLSDRFFHSLIDEPDDWSFVIKCHALLETIICSWLASHFGDQALQEVFARKMHMRARISMLRALTLANKQEVTMMEAFGTLRNRLVHNVQQTNFTFDEYFKDPKNLEKFQNNFVIGEDAEQYRLTAEAFPRQAIWTCIVLVASRSLEEEVQTRIRDAKREALQGLVDAMMKE